MKRLIVLIISFKILFSQGILPGYYKLNFSDFDSSAYKGLKSNMISDIVPQEDNLVWLGSGAGLAVLKDSISIFTISSKADILPGPLTNITPQGGVVALTSYRKTLFAAFLGKISMKDLLLRELENIIKQIAVSYFEQPIDS